MKFTRGDADYIQWQAQVIRKLIEHDPIALSEIEWDPDEQYILRHVIKDKSGK